MEICYTIKRNDLDHVLAFNALFSSSILVPRPVEVILKGHSRHVRDRWYIPDQAQHGKLLVQL